MVAVLAFLHGNCGVTEDELFRLASRRNGEQNPSVDDGELWSVIQVRDFGGK